MSKCQKIQLYVNGRFLVQKQTGVQRFAREVVKALDALIGESAHKNLLGCVALVTPPGVETPVGLVNIRHVKGGSLGSGYAWEQVDLVRLSASGVLLNLCNLAPLAKRRQVVVLHDATPHAVPEAFSKSFRVVYQVLIPAITRRAAQLATVSEFSRDEISRWCALPRSRLAICHEGGEHILACAADSSVLTRHGLNNERYFLGVGMGAANKNLEMLMAAFSQAGLGHIRLVLTGSRSARVHGSYSASDIPSDVIHVGHVTDGELRALYEGALALTYPSLYEGFGLPPLEAMTCGCPVIISDQPALLEVAVSAAKVVGMRDTPGLTTALREVANDPQLRTRLSAAGMKQAKQFTWRSTAERLLAQCKAVDE